MDCKEVQGKLAAYQEGRLGEETREAIREHVSHCPACAQELRQWERFSLFLGQYPELQAEDGFVPRFWEKVREHEDLERRKGIFFHRFAAATVVLSLLFGIIGGKMLAEREITERLAGDVKLEYFRDYPPDSLSGRIGTLVSNIKYNEGRDYEKEI